MRLFGKICALGGLLMLCLVAGLLFTQRVGVVGTVPTADPIVRLNQQYGNLSPNAADVYTKALALIAETAPEGWAGEVRQTGLPTPEIVAWIESDQGILSLLLEASAIDQCYFAQTRDPTATFARSLDTTPLRNFVTLQWRVAAARHDLALAAATIEVRSALARHWGQQPGYFAALRSAGHTSFACSAMREAFSWPDISPSDLRDFASHALMHLPEVPTMHAQITEHLEQEKWFYLSQSASLRWLTPPARLCGEVERWGQPYLDLAQQPIEQMVSVNNKLRTSITARQRTRNTPGLSDLVNLPRAAIEFMRPALLRAIELNAQAETERRGTFVLLNIFVYELEHQRLPEALCGLPAKLPNDPYANAPFQYRRDAEDFTLYSFGWDCDDDGGVHAPKFGQRVERVGNSYRPLPPDGDHVFWPIPAAE